MPYFPLITFQEITLAFFLGLGAFVLIYLAWGSYPQDRLRGMEKKPEEPETGEPLDGPQEGDNPVPPFLLLVYIGLTVWILAYLIIIGLRVKAIG
ncbi:MAG: hypothetical protein HY787_00080 [Deltaproteobacteria bacterium]|nr:hypothetical protein [Deltaproteobacteria bacterium]